MSGCRRFVEDKDEGRLELDIRSYVRGRLEGRVPDSGGSGVFPDFENDLPLRIIFFDRIEDMVQEIENSPFCTGDVAVLRELVFYSAIDVLREDYQKRAR